MSTAVATHKVRLSPSSSGVVADGSAETEEHEPVTLQRALGVMLVLAICLSFGEVINGWLF